MSVLSLLYFNIIYVISANVVISSTGGAAQRWGEFLGKYEYHEDKGYYVKTSTGQSAFGIYLYHDEDCWLVGRTPIPGEERLRSPSRSKTPPSSGWEYIDDDDEWQDDQTLTVTPCEIVLSLWMVI